MQTGEDPISGEICISGYDKKKKRLAEEAAEKHYGGGGVSGRGGGRMDERKMQKEHELNSRLLEMSQSQQSSSAVRPKQSGERGPEDMNRGPPPKWHNERNDPRRGGNERNKFETEKRRFSPPNRAMNQRYRGSQRNDVRIFDFVVLNVYFVTVEVSGSFFFVQNT